MGQVPSRLVGVVWLEPHMAPLELESEPRFSDADFLPQCSSGRHSHNREFDNLDFDVVAADIDQLQAELEAAFAKAETYYSL